MVTAKIFSTDGFKKWGSLLLKLTVPIGILLYIFSIVPLSEVMTAIAAAKVYYVAMALVVVLLMPYIDSHRMKMLTDVQSMTLSIRQIYKINLITRFYGILLPGQLASGAVRWYKLSQPDKQRAGALASIFFSRFY